jgi:hypothetical protein
MAEAVQEAGQQLQALVSMVTRRVQEQPYPVLGLAMMAGYVAGGGLFSRMTRPLARAAMGALLVPGFRQRVRDLAREVEPAATGA